jgi:hypothetical protein
MYACMHMYKEYVCMYVCMDTYRRVLHHSTFQEVCMLVCMYAYV